MAELEAFSHFALSIMQQKYSHYKKDGTAETWSDICKRVVRHVGGAVDMKKDAMDEIREAMIQRKFIPGGRYLYAAGRPYHQTQNCLALHAEDSREGWASLLYKASMALMTGAGIGVVYSDVRPEGRLIRKVGGEATGPIALMEMINQCGKGIIQGGSRRSAMWAGLIWSHQDIFKFIHIKNWDEDIRKIKARNFSFPAPLDCTNISVILDDEFFEAYNDDKHTNHSHAQAVYWAAIEQMLKTGEPGFTVDIGKNTGECLRNACGELTTADDSDVCNLGSINMARIESLEEMKKITELATMFLLAGTVYSDVPYVKVDQVRSKNRRLGLGLLGLHEFLLKRGKKYGPDDELEEYLKVYATSTTIARKYCNEWELSKSVKTRAIAPTGTIGILAETTTGIEPIYCIAYKRRYLKHKAWQYQYVIDPTAKRLIEAGIDRACIEDAYMLANDIERRLKFQAWLQQYVDHAISSTINLPAWGSKENNSDQVKNIGGLIMKYLPQLRGITCYPDGAREGQILVPVDYTTASKAEGQVFYESADICDITGKGSCGV